MSDLNQNPLNNGQPNQTESEGLQQPVNPAIGGLQQPVNPAVSGQPVQTPVMEQAPQQPSLQPMGGQFSQQSQPVNPVMQQPSVSPEMAQDFSNTMVASGADVVTKKSKKGLFIGIAASLAVLVGGSFAAYSFSPWVKNNVKMLINDPAEYYAWVEEENANTVAEDVAAAYGESLNATKTEQEVTLKAELNAESIDKFFEDSEGMSISSMGIELPAEVSLSVASKYEENGMIGSMNVATEDGAVATANVYFMDGMYYCQFPELSSSYIAMNMDTMMETAYADLDSEAAAFMEGYMNTAMDMSTDPSSVKELISENDLKDIILNYSAAVYGQIDDVELEKGVNRKVGSVDMEYNVLTAEIDTKCLYDICMEALKTAEDDKTVMGICEELGVTKDAYKEALSSLITSLEAEEIDETDDSVEMNVYVSSTGVICGREFILHNNDTDEDSVTISYICADDDNKSAFDVEFKVAENDGFVISGDMEEKSGKTNGEIAVTVNDAGEVTEIPVTFKDIETAGDNDEYLKGEVTLDLSTLGVPAITVALDSDGKGQTVSTDVVIAGTDFGKISVSASEKASMGIPAFDSSQTVYQMDETGSGIEGYVMEIEANLGTFLDNVGNAVGFEGLGDLVLNSTVEEEVYAEEDYEAYDDEYVDEELVDDELVDDEEGMLEASYDLGSLGVSINGTAVTLPAKIDGILDYVDVTDEVLEPYYYGSYYDANYTLSVTVENNTTEAVAPADCHVIGINVYEGAPIDMKIGNIGIGTSVSEIESTFGVTIENTADGYITVYDTNSDWNGVTFYWYDGIVYMMDVAMYE